MGGIRMRSRLVSMSKGWESLLFKIPLAREISPAGYLSDGMCFDECSSQRERWRLLVFDVDCACDVV
jgi:hypothetical protein